MATKDFSAVDALKSALIAAGVEVRMSKAGVELFPGPDFDPPNWRRSSDRLAPNFFEEICQNPSKDFVAPNHRLTPP